MESNVVLLDGHSNREQRRQAIKEIVQRAHGSLSFEDVDRAFEYGIRYCIQNQFETNVVRRLKYMRIDYLLQYTFRENIEMYIAIIKAINNQYSLLKLSQLVFLDEFTKKCKLDTNSPIINIYLNLLDYNKFSVHELNFSKDDQERINKKLANYPGNHTKSAVKEIEEGVKKLNIEEN